MDGWSWHPLMRDVSSNTLKLILNYHISKCNHHHNKKPNKKTMKLKPLLAFKSKVIKPCSRILSSFLHKLERRRPRRPSFSLRPSRFRRRHRRFRTKVVRFRKPFSLRSFRLPRYRPKARLRLRRRLPKNRLHLRLRRPRHHKRAPAPNGERFGEKIAELMSVFRSSRRSRELELHSGSDTGTGNGNGSGSRKEPFPSPITPAFVSRDSILTNAGSSEEADDVSDEVDDDVEVLKSFESYLAEMIVDDKKVKDLKDVEDFLYCWKNLKSPVFVDLVSRFYGDVCKELLQGDTPASH